MDNYMDYWSKEKNPESGAAFEHFRHYMECTNNGTLDVDALLTTEYGRKLTELLALRFRYERLDPMSEECLEYYKSIGIRKTMYETEDFFTRWALFTPAELEKGKKYPLIIWNKGGKEAIEDEEYSMTLIPMAAKEKFMVVMAQNTNWDNLDHIIETVGNYAPVDRERLYMGGFSQGGRVTGSAMMRIPEKITAALLNGGPVFDTTDNHNVSYTISEIEHLTTVFVPFMQLQNQCDVSNCSPLNIYRKRKNTPKVNNNYYINPSYDFMKDPTYCSDGITRERINPPEGGDPDVWLMNLLNLRLGTLGCKFRDPDICRSYADIPEDELHHAVGFYGDYEKIEEIYGLKHYRVDIYNRDNIDAFRYIVVANTNHWPPVTLGELMWDFFRQFRRDSVTGKIVFDKYIP